MPVLAEAISVIVRLDAIARCMDNDWSNFVDVVPNQTLCCDSELARVGFMCPADADEFVAMLETRGFRYLDESGAAVDLVIVDQMQGPMVTCEWLEWGTVRMNAAGEKATYCRRQDGKEQQFYTPDGWKFEGSLSQRFDFIQEEDPSKRYRYLRKQDGVDVYYDTATGREVYAGRVSEDP